MTSELLGATLWTVWSLRRLQTDHIDLYQIHGNDSVTPVEETIRALDTLVQQGKVRYLGCSNWMGFIPLGKERGRNQADRALRGQKRRQLRFDPDGAGHHDYFPRIPLPSHRRVCH